MDRIVRIQLRDLPVQQATFLQLRKVCGVFWNPKVSGPIVVGIVSAGAREETCIFNIVRINEDFDPRQVGGYLGMFDSGATLGNIGCVFGSCFA